MRRDLSSIVRESCSKARKRAEGNRGEESEATGPDIGPVLSLPFSPPLGFRAFFPPFYSSCMAVAFSRWASNRNRDPPKPRRSLHVDSSALCLLRNLSCLSRSSRLLFFSSWLHLFSTRSLALSSCFFASSPSSCTYYR